MFKHDGGYINVYCIGCIHKMNIWWEEEIFLAALRSCLTSLLMAFTQAFLVSSDGDPGDGPAPGFRRALIVKGNDGVTASPGGATAGGDSIQIYL